MTHKSFLSTTTMLALLVLTTLAPRAYATRIFAGSECQIFNPSVITSIPVYDFAGIANDSSAVDDLTVVCPVVRDNTSNTNGTSDFTVRVVSSGGNSVLCALYSLDEDSTLVDVHLETTTSGTPVTLNLDVNLSTNKGYYNMVCTLPPGAAVFNYRIKEY